MKHANVKMYHIEMLEFLEMTGRVAETYYSGENIPLHEKINKVLDEWLPLINF